MGDIHTNSWYKFVKDRQKTLFERFTGWLRAEVVETNDPLRMHRIRFKCPELHDYDLAPEKLPWAAPAFSMGGARAGHWTHPCIGDIIYIVFEKNHPYSPMWVAAADPTRRKNYPYFSIYGKTPQAVNEKGEPAESPSDYDEDYLPADERPMSTGWTDRYGTTFIISSVGYYPSTHEETAAPTGTDGISQSTFQTSQSSPKSNDPDMKYAALITKYGSMMVINDGGYEWTEEFSGNAEEDEEFEIKRYKYLLKQISEEESSGKDQRRFEVRTRYGHKIELRDVGWNKSRSGEYDEQKTIGSGGDERWIKLRSKGGHYMQMADIGIDPEEDDLIKRLNKVEHGLSTEEEDQYFGNDAKLVRLQSRKGNKIVIDDRGDMDEPGNGILLRTDKGQIAINDKDDLKNIIVALAGMTMELNDMFGFASITGPLRKSLLPEKDGEHGVETPLETTAGQVPYDADHLLVDARNKMLRLKTRGGQGVEFKDYNDCEGEGCPEWGEIRDAEDRGIWFNPKGGYTVWRAKEPCVIDRTRCEKVENLEKQRQQRFAKQLTDEAIAGLNSGALSQEEFDAQLQFIEDLAAQGKEELKNIKDRCEKALAEEQAEKEKKRAEEAAARDAARQKEAEKKAKKRKTECDKKVTRNNQKFIPQRTALFDQFNAGQLTFNQMKQQLNVMAERRLREEGDIRKECEQDEEAAKQEDEDNAAAEEECIRQQQEAADQEEAAAAEEDSSKKSYIAIKDKPAARYAAEAGIDEDEFIIIRNDKGKVQIITDQNVEIKATENIIMEADENISIKAGKQIVMEADGTKWVIKKGLVGTNEDLTCRRMSGQHTVLQIPEHPAGPAPTAGTEGQTQKVEPKEIPETKPGAEKGCEDGWDKDRGCAPNWANAGTAQNGNPGGGSQGSRGGGGIPVDQVFNVENNRASGTDRPDRSIPPIIDDPNEDIIDPLDEIINRVGGRAPNGGVLWYGTSDVFLEELSENGLQVEAATNNLYDPENPTDVPVELHLAIDSTIARDENRLEINTKTQAKLAVERYGGNIMILRIRAVDDIALLSEIENNIEEASYMGDIPPEYIEVFSIDS